MSDKRINILLIEDNAGDARLISEMLSEAKRPQFDLECVGRLSTGLPRLAAGGVHVVLLDLNLPRKDGREVLAEIKADLNLRCIPVVILTTSQDEHDVLGAYESHANCYIVKPVDLGQFIAVVKSIEDFWFQVVRLPPD
ncbi:MAG TPA: response regulator, partial [Roseiflexaceae bacterium]